jgi:hypothetical protein
LREFLFAVRLKKLGDVREVWKGRVAPDKPPSEMAADKRQNITCEVSFDNGEIS